MSPYTLGWLLWIAWFVIEEGVALTKGGKGATLSAHVWWWFGTTTNSLHVHPNPTAGLRARRFALAAFLAWLCLHFLTGGVF